MTRESREAEPEPVLVCWSGGKGSALALHAPVRLELDRPTEGVHPEVDVPELRVGGRKLTPAVSCVKTSPRFDLSRFTLLSYRSLGIDVGADMAASSSANPSIGEPAGPAAAARRLADTVARRDLRAPGRPAGSAVTLTGERRVR